MTAAPQVRVLLLQLGGPVDLTQIEPFLANLFADVLPLPGFLRRPLARLIARRRTPEVTPLYREIGGGSPLLANTEAQRQALIAALRTLGIEAAVQIAMRYAPPRVDTALAALRQLPGQAPLVALSLYPHYSYATSRTSLRELDEFLLPAERAAVRCICAFPDAPAYLDAMAATLQRSLDALPAANRARAHVIFSAHGLPLRLVRQGDPYPQHIATTVAGIMARLTQPPAGHTLSFQSRVGPVKWLEPDTVVTVQRLAAAGERHLVVVPVAFVSEHIETLHELDIQLRDTAREAGVETFVRVPTVGSDPGFIAALAGLVQRRLQQPGRCCGCTARCDYHDGGSRAI